MVARLRQRKKPARKPAAILALPAARKPGPRQALKLRGPMAYLIDEAVGAGLLAGEKSEHISARTTRALVAAAQRRTGIASKTALVEVALAFLALPDPAAKFMRDHRGELGRDHTLAD